MSGVRGKWVVVGAGVVVAANLALFLWARDNTRGCFLTKDEIAGRWGPTPAAGAPLPTPEEFRAASPVARQPLVRGLIDEHALYGVGAADVEARFGPSDGRSPGAGMPAYRIGEDGWNLVFVIGESKGKTDVVRDVVVWKERCS